MCGSWLWYIICGCMNWLCSGVFGGVVNIIGDKLCGPRCLAGDGTCTPGG
jgi:uncharacterized membrane protein YuzA (DUF378 family)